MSKSVRIADYLHAEIERLAAAEKRSLANMVQVLLEQALQLPEHFERAKVMEAGPPREMISVEPDGRMHDVPADPHFKPDFKGKK